MSLGRLQNRIAMITGAGAGIGRAAALRFAAEGVHVIALNVDGGFMAAGVLYDEAAGEIPGSAATRL